MKIKTLRKIRLEAGAVPVGSVMDVPESLAKFFLGRGEAEMYVPFAEAGPAESLSVSPPAQASTEKTLNESDSGEKRRGRKKSAPSA